jgi:predicted ribosomally synthesized peptide with nif11-like leader
MSDDAARAAVERMKTDEAFRERVASAADVDARLSLLIEEGYDCASGELEMRSCALSDDALDFVSGSELLGPSAGSEPHHLL